MKASIGQTLRQK